MKIAIICILLAIVCQARIQYETGIENFSMGQVELGIPKTVKVVFSRAFSVIPIVSLSLEKIGFDIGNPQFDVSLLTVQKDYFSFTVNVEEQSAELKDLSVRWVAVLDSKFQFKYVNLETPDLALSTEDGPQYQYVDFSWDRPFESEPQAALFILGTHITGGDQLESICYIESKDENGGVINCQAESSLIEHISVLIVAGPESSSYATFGGGNKALDTRSSWNHGVGTRLDDFSIDVDPLFIEQGGFIFQGFSGFDTFADTTLRVQLADNELSEDFSYNFKIGTWGNSVLNGLWLDVFVLVPSDNCAILYSECNFSGVQLSVCQGEPVNSIQAAQFGDLPVKSVKVPSGRTVTLFEDNDLQGRYSQVRSDVACLESDWVFS